MLPCWFPKAVRRLIQLYAQVYYCYLSSITELLSWGTGMLVHMGTNVSGNGMLLASYRGPILPLPCVLILLVVLMCFIWIGLSYHVLRMILQGPLGWQSVSGLPVGEGLLHRDIDFVMNVDEDAEISAISLEATIQKHIEEELYNSALEVYVYISLEIIIHIRQFSLNHKMNH